MRTGSGGTERQDVERIEEKGRHSGSTIAEISRDGSYRGECIISWYNAVLSERLLYGMTERGKYSFGRGCLIAHRLSATEFNSSEN